MANNHKLQLIPSLSGYEIKVKDVTGFGDDGYNFAGLNQNKVKAILLQLKSDFGEVLHSVRLEGEAKNEFMAGISAVDLYDGTEEVKNVLKTGMYTVDSHLLTTEAAVTGLLNYSEITGTELNLLMVGDKFIVAGTEVYGVTKVTNANTILILDRPLVAFTNKVESGFSFRFKVPVYIQALKVLFQLGSLNSNTLQKDGEAANFAALAGYVQVVKLAEGNHSENLYRILRNAEVISNYLSNKYLRV